MKKEYNSFESFKDDLNKEFTFKEIAVLCGWLTEEEVVGQLCKCKFHEERTGSMQIGDHFFKCWSAKCGEKGDIFTFGEKIENCSFIEIANQIATNIGCHLKIKNGYASDEISKKKKEMSTLWEKYKKDYLDNCKTNPEMVKEGNRYFPFDVGYDKIENRVVLAFMKNGEPLGFTKRRIGDGNTSKWKHSNIEHSLTGLVNQIFNIDSLRKFEKAYIVEGPGDVASMTRSGYINTICCCGTSNISEKVLQRLTAERIYCLTLVTDGDEPGIGARHVWCKEIIKFDYFLALNSFVGIIPYGKDPGSCNKEELDNMEETKLRLIDYFVQNITIDQIFEIFKDKGFNKNPIKKLLIAEFGNRESLDFEDAKAVIENRCHSKVLDSSEQEDLYICQLKSTAGIGDYGLRYDKIDSLTPERAMKILKLRYKGGSDEGNR